MTSAPPVSAVPPLTDVSAEVIPYASPGIQKPRITYRGAITTLAVGGILLLFSLGLLMLAWSIFKDFAEQGGRNSASALEVLGVFVCALAGLSFLVGLITVFVGLRGVRQRELA